jgi:Ohr subfamily peroxiredoxin
MRADRGALARVLDLAHIPLAVRDRGQTPPARNAKETSMDKIKPLFTASASSTGGRNGHTRASDGLVDVDLSVAKEMGGPGKPGATTPEHLFAAGYAACFGGALDFVAKSHKKSASGATTACAVTIGPREGGGFGLAVKLDVTDTSLPQAELQAFAQEAHEKICPYSHATRGNVDVEIAVHGS